MKVSDTVFKVICCSALVLLTLPAMPFCHIMPLLLTSEDSHENQITFFCERTPVTHAETIPEASATILGLISFGLLVGIRVGGPQRLAQIRSLLIVFVAFVVIMTLQMYLIIYVNLGALHTLFYTYAMTVTTVALFVVGMAFVNMIVIGSQLGAIDSNYDKNIKKDISTHASTSMG